MAALPGLDQLVGGQPFHVAGGQQQTLQEIEALAMANQMEATRHQVGTGLLQYLSEIAQSPFSIVPAMQAYGQGGQGGTLAPNVDLASTGGAGRPSPYGEIASRLMRELSEYAGATPINPHTGQAFSPDEMEYLRLVTARDMESKGANYQQTGAELARAEPNREGLSQGIYRLPEGIPGTQWLGAQQPPKQQPSPQQTLADFVKSPVKTTAKPSRKTKAATGVTT